MIILIINGAPRTGKDTFIELLQNIAVKRVVSYSSIEWVKEMALFMGWDNNKDVKGRRFLSDIKDACTRYADIPFKKITKYINWYKEHPLVAPGYICINIREPEEIQKLVDWCKIQNIPCYSIWIRRLSAETTATETMNNHADTSYMKYAYDYTIQNESTLEDYEKNIKSVIKLINNKEDTNATCL